MKEKQGKRIHKLTITTEELFIQRSKSALAGRDRSTAPDIKDFFRTVLARGGFGRDDLTDQPETARLR